MAQNIFGSVGSPYLSYANMTDLWISGSNVAGAQMDYVDATETTTSTSYTDLSTVGPSVTVNVPRSGLILVFVRVEAKSSSGTGQAYAGWNVVHNGTQRLGPTTRYAAIVGGTNFDSATSFGLYRAADYGAVDSGVAVINMKYVVDAATTGTFHRRVVVAVPL